MEEFLKIVEEPSSTEVPFDADRLKCFNSKLKVWGYAKTSAVDSQKLSFGDRSSILKKYYVDMSAKYLVGGGKISFTFSA